ncbi:N-acetylglucosamine-6-phosphate deacetylase [Paenibacillus ginsengarvi]|uniref:N-acetylglucosamine-6-phosphate deacetylase n=2 Tax=Paenibacillus ginsengarvi TaxID=400777 RepID=A0A3B0CKN5_9BACL|nr:N-acetylglucosamine-6-phosphate deacetylase [Paenibacillus ginsengarvi]
MLEGKHYATGKPVRVLIRDGVIAGVEALDYTHAEELPWIAPGLVDLQINGYAGDDFNTLPFDTDMVVRASQGLWGEGVTSYYPTVITNSPEAIEEAVGIIASACDHDARTNRSVAGIHVEGPFISPEDGARGAHSLDYVRAPDWEMFEKWQRAAGGRIRILTLSPEWPNSAEFIAKCSASGVTVSIGHTSATPEQIREAVRAGARMSTHLGNGAHLTMPRHPNYIWEQLAQDDLWSCVIADGFHLPESVLKVIFKTKGAQALMVSDAVYLCGMPSGEYTTHVGGKVVLTEEGRLSLASNPKILAGSAQMLVWGIEHVVRCGLASLSEAWDMSSIRPAAFMKLTAAQGIADGAPADLVLFEQAGDRVRVLETYKDGELVYELEETR